MSIDRLTERCDNDRQPLYSGTLFIALSSVAAGGMIASCGVGRLFARGASAEGGWELVLVVGGLVLGLCGGIWTALLVRGLATTRDDCVLYGRHIVGLTFVLLVTGLCNSVATSTLAFEGVLEFSAARLIDASNPDLVRQRREKHEAALLGERKATRDVQSGEVARNVAKAEESAACAAGALGSRAGASATPSDIACEAARREALAAEHRATALGYALDDAREETAETRKDCDESRGALFFLLSVSTMMALFGAAFYVVNRVRIKRPRLRRNPDDGGSGPEVGTPADSDAETVETETTVVTTAMASASPGSVESNGATANHSVAKRATHAAPSARAKVRTVTQTHSKAHEHDPFDVHAFWSGAFFRIGEAVLFTFAFFWLIWTSSSSGLLIWLPVLALFVGMFVKTGETIVFRLGLRILSAAEALLPAGPAAISTTRSETTDETREQRAKVSRRGATPRTEEMGDEPQPN